MKKEHLSVFFFILADIYMMKIITLDGLPGSGKDLFHFFASGKDLFGLFSAVRGGPIGVGIDPGIVLKANETALGAKGIVSDEIAGIIIQTKKIGNGGDQIHGRGHLLHRLRLKLVTVDEERSSAKVMLVADTFQLHYKFRIC